MSRPVKIFLLFLVSLTFAQPDTATAAKQTDVSELIKLVRQASTDNDKPSYYLSYMGFDYTVFITLKDGKPESVEVVAETFYGSKEDFKTYIITDDNMDGVVDYGTYKQGGVVKETFDRQKETNDTIKQNCQSLYNSAVRYIVRKLRKKE